MARVRHIHREGIAEGLGGFGNGGTVLGLIGGSFFGIPLEYVGIKNAISRPIGGCA